MDLTEQLLTFARAAGADSVGVVSAEEYEAKVPNLQKPSYTAEGMRSLICFVRHMLTGSFATQDIPVQSMNSHACMDAIERISMEIADWLERKGYLGIPIPPEAADLNLQRSPAGALDFKWVAEESGVGTVGLELNLLTPDYGPRVYIGVVMTDAPLRTSSKIKEQLCPGMRCGRCAVICPTQAIPLQAPRGVSVNEYRDLDKRACALGAERLGIQPLLLNLKRLIFSSGKTSPQKVLSHIYWKDFWQSINCKLGAFAACFECFYVCPPGAKDFRKIIQIPYRKQDIPPGMVKRRYFDEMVEMVYVGVPEERREEYRRGVDFEPRMDKNVLE